VLIVILIIRSLLYFLHIGSLHIRINPTAADIVRKTHVLTNLYYYSYILAADTYLGIAFASIMLDSISISHAFNVVVIIIAWFTIQNISKKLANQLRFGNPPIDDIQLCQFLVATKIFFIGLLLAKILTLCAMLLAVLHD
jgi:hypothetical protein